MAIPKRPGPLDPAVERAAEAGDVVAMRLRGQHLYASGDNHAAEEWLLAAARAGDAEAMYSLSHVYHDRVFQDEAHDVTAGAWCRRAAEAKYVPAIRAMSSWVDLDEREFWLRKAWETGDLGAAYDLAGLFEEEGRPSEAEHWYRIACREPGHGGHVARGSWAAYLVYQGRFEDAAELLAQNAGEGSSAAARFLSDVLERLGRTEEAAAWRERVDSLRAAEHEQELLLRSPASGPA
ncbi:hypothetical protein AB0B30_28080 [Streptomyces narbonensis]|uniref:Sel1 repeat family protein n=1 Tax=Streptomyces narbonensis TaxID=67333 RepID=A0ABV3CDY5_9ACTN